MKVTDHPYLEGVKCREDGAVWVPAGGRNRGWHWTLGHIVSGYRKVGIGRRCYRVHRLICEAFHGICPSDKEVVDHINRVKDDNRPENLRWVTVAENARNCVKVENSIAKYGVSYADDKKAYQREYYKRTRGASKKEPVQLT